MKLSRRQKRILKRKLKRIAVDAVAVIVGAGMFVGLFIAWANEPMPDWSEYIEENHIGMVQVEGSDTWLTQEEYEQMCKERETNRKEVTNNENGNEGRTDTHKRSRQCPVHNHKELGKDEVEQADADTKRTG